MSRKRKVKAVIRDRKFKGHSEVTPLGKGMFSYRGYLYNVNSFPQRTTINLDQTSVEPVAEAAANLGRSKKRKNKKKKKKWPKDKRAYLFSNIEECPDARIP